jgi:hypothetical protein
MKSVRVALVAAACLLVSAAADASLRAERITRKNAAELLIGGPDAIGGVGDWYLANDVIEIIVDDPWRQHAKLNHGGTIIDAGLRHRKGDDQFARLFPIVNMDQRVQINFNTMRAEVNASAGWARLTVSSSQGMSTIARGGAVSRWLDPLVPETQRVAKVYVETEYSVFPGEPFVHITTTIRNRGDRPAPVFSYGDVWMRGGRSIRSWVGNSLAPRRSRGFHHLSFDRRNVLAAREALAPFTYVAMPGLPQFPPLTYAIFSPERVERGRLHFGVTGQHVTLVSVFTGDPGWQDAGLLRLLGATRDELPAGAVWTYRRRLLLVDRAEIAAATDVIFPLVGYADGSSGVFGRALPASERFVIQVDDAASGAPVTQLATRTDGPRAGRYRAVLPAGEYLLTMRSAHRPERSIAVSVPQGRFTEIPAQHFPEPGWLRFAPAFADGGGGRIVVTGIGATRDPVFQPELLDFRIDGVPGKSGTDTNQLYFVGHGHDPGGVPIAPGRYRLTATRGPEFDLARFEVEISAPGVERVVPPFELHRVVSLPGLVSADFHVHSEASDDSGMGNETRLRSFVAEGVDVMVSTDHDHLGNFEAALDALGVRDRIRVIQGVEITSSAPSRSAPWTIGHHNAWPIPYQPMAHRKGAPPSQNRTVAELYAGLRRDFGAEIVQLNHAVGKQPGLSDGSYFTHLGSVGEPYDPARPIDAAPNRTLLELASDGSTRAIDFDAIELMNGDSFGQYRQLREVWYSLLRQGFRRTGTGNSDSHGPDELAGYPRNYVEVDHRAATADPSLLNQAIRDGRLFATTGPLITTFRVNGARMGETVAVSTGRAEVEIAVAAAPWVPVDEVRLLVNGRVVRRFAGLRDSGGGQRLQVREELTFEGDGFVTLEAGAALDVDPQRWAERRGGEYAAVVARGFVSQAISNPIYVDVDGNGRFDPPAFEPPPSPGAVSHRLVLAALVALVLGIVGWRLRRRAGLAGPGSGC